MTHIRTEWSCFGDLDVLRDEKCFRALSFLLLVVRPGAPGSVLPPSSFIT